MLGLMFPNCWECHVYLVCCIHALVTNLLLKINYFKGCLRMSEELECINYRSILIHAKLASCPASGFREIDFFFEVFLCSEFNFEALL